MTKNCHLKKKASVSFEPPNYWSAVRHANHYTKWAGCEWLTQKSFHYPTVMVDWFQLNSANSSNPVNLIQNRKNATVDVSVWRECIGVLLAGYGRRDPGDSGVRLNTEDCGLQGSLFVCWYYSLTISWMLFKKCCKWIETYLFFKHESPAALPQEVYRPQRSLSWLGESVLLSSLGEGEGYTLSCLGVASLYPGQHQGRT